MCLFYFVYYIYQVIYYVTVVSYVIPFYHILTSKLWLKLGNLESLRDIRVP